MSIIRHPFHENRQSNNAKTDDIITVFIAFKIATTMKRVLQVLSAAAEIILLRALGLRSAHPFPRNDLKTRKKRPQNIDSLYSILEPPEKCSRTMPKTSCRADIKGYYLGNKRRAHTSLT